MELKVLGHLSVRDADGPIALTAAKERLLLARLTTRVGAVVPVATLVATLWGDQPPASANKTLQTYVLHLRRFLGHRLVTETGGYSLVLDPSDSFDALAFEHHLEHGRLAVLRGNAVAAIGSLTTATALWSGVPYSEFDDPAFVVEARRLEELYLSAVEDLLELRSDRGDNGDVIAECERLVDQFPVRERLWSILMQALYRDARQVDALRAYQRARTVLLDELGVEPGPALRTLEQAVLAHDPSLLASEDPPLSLYARTRDGLKIGYWTRGDGPPDIVLCAEWVFNLELLWDMPEIRPLLDRLIRGGRLIVVQRRGTGVSERSDDASFAPPEACTADVDAVLDELGCGRVGLVGWGHGGQVALAYAAARPDRVSSVAVVNGYARLSATDGYDVGHPPELLEGFLEMMESTWGTDGPVVQILGAASGGDPAVRARIARLNHLLATPRQAVATQRAIHDFDVRDVARRVTQPTLVVTLDASVTGVPVAQWLTDHMPNAELLVLPGNFLPAPHEATALADALVSFVRSHD